MRKGKLAAAQRLRKSKVKQHTPTERLALRRKKRKEGPSAVRRAEKRQLKRDVHALALLKQADKTFLTANGDQLTLDYEARDQAADALIEEVSHGG